MSNALTIKQHLADPKVLAQFRLALPAHITPEKFQRAALTAMLNSKDIAECTPGSVMNALLKCAQDGLIPDNKEAAIVKYGNVATYMPMVYGLIKRMRNSGDVKAVNAHLVYSKDQFDYIIENGVEKFTHKPKFEGDRGELVLAYAVITLDDGTPHVEIMTKEEIEKARATSKAGANSPAWKNWFSEMAKKTVIHRAAKRVPTSSEVEKLLQSDMRVTLNGSNDEDAPAGTSLIDSINSAIDLEDNGEQSVTVEPGQDDIFPPDRK